MIFAESKASESNPLVQSGVKFFNDWYYFPIQYGHLCLYDRTHQNHGQDLIPFWLHLKQTLSSMHNLKDPFKQLWHPF